MRRILIAGEEMLPAIAVMVLALVLVNLAAWRDWKKTGLYTIFCLYLVIVSALVGLPNIGYVRFDANVNLVPFIGMVGDLKNSLLNVAMLIPLGFLLPCLWRRFRSWKAAALEGLCVSLFIELAQIFTLRATDINDLITNVAGTLLGFLLAKKLLRSSLGYPARDRWLLYSAVLLTRMAAFPILWHWIYG